MAMRLLERAAQLAVLHSALVEAVAGVGSVVLVFGEAGSATRASCGHSLRDAVNDRVRILAGACDDLLSPRALGPFREVARAAGSGPLATALAEGDRDALLAAVREELSDPHTPTVLLVEDAHWADEATLDVLRYIGRRMGDLPAVLLITYRDDEIGADHPLRRVLGGLSGSSVHRVAVPPLTRAAVTSWPTSRCSSGPTSSRRPLSRRRSNPCVCWSRAATARSAHPRCSTWGHF
jgi:predicted ATPase